MTDPVSAHTEPTAKPLILICYHRLDERKKDLLLDHLNDALGDRAEICTGNTFALAAGQAESEAQSAREQVAVLLITPTFLSSQEFTEVEVPALLEAHAAGKMRILPLVTPECIEKAAAWLTSLGAGLERDVTIWQNVFVSYSSKDQAYARELKQALRRHEFFVWMDDDIGAGTPWTEVLKDRLKQCTALIVVWTADSEASIWVKRELLYAQQNAKQIFPVLYEGQKPGFEWGEIQGETVQPGKLPSESFYAQLGSIREVQTCRLPLPSALSTPPRPRPEPKPEPKPRFEFKPWMGAAVLVLVVAFLLYRLVIQPAISPPATPTVAATRTLPSVTKTLAETHFASATLTAANTPTTAPSLTPTAANTSTTAPSFTPTTANTPTPKPSPAPTNTLTPTEAPTLPPTSTPTSTPTPTPTSTPVPPPRWLPAPTLLAPENGASFTGWNANVTLQWTPVEGVRDNEYYVVRIPYDEAGRVAEFWRKETQMRVPSHFSSAEVGFEDRHYDWSVQVMRCLENCDQISDDNEKKEGLAVGNQADGVFYWHPDIPPRRTKPTPS